MLLAESGKVTAETLAQYTADGLSEILYLKFTQKPLNGIEYQRWRRQEKPAFHAPGRLAQVGLISRISAALFSLSLLAYDGSKLSISTIGNKQTEFRVEVDGRRIQMKDNVVTLNNLSSGRHNVRVFRVKKGGNIFSRKQELIYASSVNLRPGFHLDITLNRFGKAFLDERRIERYDDWFDEGYDDLYEDDFAQVMPAGEVAGQSGVKALHGV